MNLSTHSISSHSARYSAKPADAAADAAAPAEPNAEFDALFSDVAQRRDCDEANNGSPKTVARPHSRRAESPSSRPRARTEEEQKVAKQKPNENLLSQLDAPIPQPAGEVELDGDEILNAPDTAMTGAEEDTTLDDKTGGEAIAPALFGVGDDTDFAAAQLPLETGVPIPDGDVARISAANVKDAAVAGRIAVEEVQDSAGVNLVREVPEEEKAKNAITPPDLKRAPAKSLGDANRKAADFADFESEALPLREKPDVTSEKNFLTNANKDVTSQVGSRGINVAKAASEMNQPASPHELASLLSKPAATHEVSARSSFEVQNPPATPTAQNLPVAQGMALSGLHRAVNAAVEAGERMKNGQRAVDLQFSFGSDDLSVRVELHEGRVRATFRTDSAELRGALAQEWQALNAAGVDRAKRFADPVFASNSASSAAGDHPEKRGARDQNLPASAERFEVSNSRGGSASAAARPVAPVKAPQTAAPSTALRLHTFA